MWRAWVWASAVLCALLAYAGTARAECTKDVDCEGELVCEAGACVEAPQPAARAEPAPAPEPAPAVTTAPPPPNLVARDAMSQEPKKVTFDPPPSAATVRYRRRSGGLMAGGIVAVSIGTLALLAEATAERETDYGPWVLAGVLLGSGIPMIVFGSKKVPDTSAPRAALAPWLTLQGGGLGVRLAL